MAFQNGDLETTIVHVHDEGGGEGGKKVHEGGGTKKVRTDRTPYRTGRGERKKIQTKYAYLAATTSTSHLCRKLQSTNPAISRSTRRE
jgi:hypothetical protein